MDLLQLQSKIKRDPVAYREEFLQQQRHFVAELQVFLLKPSKEFKQFATLVSFLAQVRFLRQSVAAVLGYGALASRLATRILTNSCASLRTRLLRFAGIEYLALNHVEGSCRSRRFGHLSSRMSNLRTDRSLSLSRSRPATLKTFSSSLLNWRTCWSSMDRFWSRSCVRFSCNRLFC